MGPDSPRSTIPLPAAPFHSSGHEPALPGGPANIPVLESQEKDFWLDVIPQLLDDRSDPDFRETYGMLARRARGLDVALTHIRLATLDLSEAELGKVHRVRLLLAEVSAAALDAEAHAVLHQPKVAENLRRLTALVHLGRIEVRSAPLGGWAPDFSVFRDHDGSFAVLIGPHRFGGGALHRGPEIASLHGAAAAARTAQRFHEIWEQAHDISPAIFGILTQAERRAHGPGKGTGYPGSAGKNPTGTTISGPNVR